MGLDVISFPVVFGALDCSCAVWQWMCWLRISDIRSCILGIVDVVVGFRRSSGMG